MTVLGLTEQEESDERPPLEVKGAAGLLLIQALGLLLGLLGTEPAEIDQLDLHVGRRGDHTGRAAVTIGERAPQDLMAPQQLRQGAFDHPYVEGCGVIDGNGDVVGRPLRIQMVKKPEALLAEG